MQDQHDRANRDDVGRAVIQDMKNNMSGANKKTFSTQQSKEIERLRRIEMNERTKEEPGQAHPGVRLQDDDSSIIGGIPDFSEAELDNDPLDLDGDIGRIGKLNFGKNHVRITNGDIIEDYKAKQEFPSIE